jgi:hypothetical protein
MLFAANSTPLDHPRMASNLARVREIRRANLSALLDQHGQAKLGELTQIAPAFLWQMGKGEGKARRGISDETAEKIERALDLEPGSLSTDRQAAPPSQPARLDPIKLANLIEAVEGAAASQGLNLPPRFKARVIAALYADSGDEPLTALAIRAALSAVMSSLEE